MNINKKYITKTLFKRFKKKGDLLKEKIIRLEKLIPLKEMPFDQKDIFIVKLTIHTFKSIIFTHQ